MSDIEITLSVRGGEVTLPYEQALTLAAVLGDFENPIWHRNDCGCCLAVHERENPTWGYVIGSDGGLDRVEVPR